MTSVMLATYPEVFAGGAIIAGLPYGAATNMQRAFEIMYQCPPRAARAWGELVRKASRHKGPWPRVSVWHGGADATVIPPNAAEIIKQWSDVHGLPVQPSFEAMVNGYPRQVWVNAAGDELIESYTIPSMAHGTPLATGTADDQCGATGPFLLEVGISSSYHIARFFGLAANRRASESSRRPLRTRVPEMLDGAEGAKSVSGAARRRSAGAELPAKREASTPRYRCGHRRCIEKHRSLKERLAIGIIHSADAGSPTSRESPATGGGRFEREGHLQAVSRPARHAYAVRCYSVRPCSDGGDQQA